MAQPLYFLTALIIATLGGLLGVKLKLPVGGMLGAMLATAIYNLIFDPVVIMPDGFRLLFQIPLGVMIGSQVRKQDLLHMRSLGKSAGVVIGSFLIFNLLAGLMIYAISGFNAVTSLFATAPGGAIYMAILAEHYGGSVATVAILQMFRNSSVMVFIAPFYRKLLGKRYGQFVPSEEVMSESIPTETAENMGTKSLTPLAPKSVNKPVITLSQLKQFLATLACSTLFGLAFPRLGMPAGEIVGAMVGAVIYNVLTGKAKFLPQLKIPIRILSGFFVGVNITREVVSELAQVPLVLVIIFVYIWLTTYVTAYLVHKLTGLDFASSLLASTPGGMSEMAIIADDMGIGAPKIAVIHTIRLVTVITFFPPVLLWVLSFTVG